ncbi:MAG: SDR family oxidoreductase [Planctomycetaceae bacterium]|nr:SDR family oxidoreductase [Planctomycetaceae bacterium]
MAQVDKQRLKNKTIVIVGGTSGLGLSAASACAAEGARLVLVGRDESKCQQAIADFDSAAVYLVGDASLPTTSEAAIALAVERFGHLDGLYHVAGGSGRRRGDGPLDQITDEGWDFTLRLNLDSLFYSNRAAVQQFLRQDSAGSILNMSSVLAESPSPHFFATHAYAATKAAAIGLTKASAAYYAAQNIRFNVLAPALVDTPLAHRALADDETMEYIRTKQPLDGGRVGYPADADQAVIFFLGDESHFVTGQVLAIDGGWSVSEGQHQRASKSTNT